MHPPQNLSFGPFLLTPAERPGFGRFWGVYRLLDWGEVAHALYLGVLVAEEGETVEALLSRVREKFPDPSE
jgi:hypothetical protein